MREGGGEEKDVCVIQKRGVEKVSISLSRSHENSCNENCCRYLINLEVKSLDDIHHITQHTTAANPHTSNIFTQTPPPPPPPTLHSCTKLPYVYIVLCPDPSPSLPFKSLRDYLIKLIHCRANGPELLLWYAACSKHSIQQLPVVHLHRARP